MRCTSLVLLPILFLSTERLFADPLFATEQKEKVLFTGGFSAQSDCLEWLEILFPRALHALTLKGQVQLHGNAVTFGVESIVPRRGLSLMSMSEDARLFQFRIVPQLSTCPDRSQFTELVVLSGIQDVNGLALARDLRVALDFSDKAPANALTPEQPEQEVLASWTADDTPAFSSAGSIDSKSLNRALFKLQSWQDEERRESGYQLSDLRLLPLAGTQLRPSAPERRKNHFASADVAFALRRAAKFVEFLFADSFATAVSDISGEGGDTPWMIGFDGKEKILLHPQGSHLAGRDADIQYFWAAEESERATVGRIDVERNFWLLYALLESSGIDLIISAYADELKAYAQALANQGMVNDLVAGRFAEVLLRDQGLNHDRHFHLSLRNSIYGGESQLFATHDDAYSCFISNGFAKNYCLK